MSTDSSFCSRSVWTYLWSGGFVSLAIFKSEECHDEGSMKRNVGRSKRFFVERVAEGVTDVPAFRDLVLVVTNFWSSQFLTSPRPTRIFFSFAMSQNITVNTCSIGSQIFTPSPQVGSLVRDPYLLWSSSSPSGGICLPRIERLAFCIRNFG